MAPHSPDQVLQSFAELAASHNHSIPRQQLQEFVWEHFQAAGQELESWTPEDWKARYDARQWEGEGPLGGSHLPEPWVEGVLVFIQSQVPAEDLRRQAAHLGGTAASALEKPGEEGNWWD